MNYVNDGPVIAKINGNKKKIYVSSELEEKEHQHREIKLPTGQSFQIVPNPETEREILMIIGSSGSGKSYFAKQYCAEYTKLHPKNQIYLLSSLTSDPTVDSIKNLNRLDINHEDFLDEPIDIESFANSLVIADDCEAITNKLLRAKITAILDQLLTIGRHHNISVIFINHTACDGARTKKILNECSSITIFLRTLGGKALDYLLKSYMALDTKQVKKLKKMRGHGRACTILKSYPQIAITDRMAYVIGDDEDDV